jgi:Phage integrase, N-terminal SAM-like domain
MLEIGPSSSMAEQRTFNPPFRERVTVAEFMETWLAAAPTSTRPQTWNGYEQITRNHIVPTLGAHQAQCAAA